MCSVQISCLRAISSPAKSRRGSGSPSRGTRKKELVEKLYGLPTTSGSKNKINTAIQAATVDDLFDKLRFVNEIGAQFLSHLREEVGTHTVQGTVALRRQIRERRQYVYAKSLEAQERQTYERKQQLKDALATGKPLPPELKKQAAALGNDLIFDEAQAEPTSHIDNEYSRAGVQDPKIVITTSRDPSSKLLQFTKEMRLVFPNSHRINRGNYVVKELAEACRANDVTDLIVLHEHRGVPDAMIVSHFPHGPTVYFTLSNVLLRHDIGNYKDSTVSEQYPHLIFENFSSKLGGRMRDVLKYLFPVPKEDSKRVMTFANENDFISFRHHVFVKTPPRDVQLAEVGPRFELKPYEIRLGTIEQTEADREWVLSHYSRTAKKRNLLASGFSRPNAEATQRSERPSKKAKR
ncbi:anticodon-binding protein [Amanita rubescens]|nr:anticodon-binding protein [Amanita rubescens]